MQARRRRDGFCVAPWPAPSFRIAARRPPEQRVPEDNVGNAVEQDEGAVRQLLQAPRVQASAVVVSEPLGVEPAVELVGSGRARQAEEAPVVLMPALGARPVPGGERSGLVEEEETRVATGRHRLAPASPELEPARDPATTVVASADLPILVVQAATVAEHEPSLGRLDQFAKRRDTVAQRHEF